MAARQRAGTGNTTGADAMPSTQPSSSVVDISDAAAAALSRSDAYRVTSFLFTEDAVDALCKKHGVPTAYAARRAGNRRACMPPPERTVCMYVHVLEAGVRFPLHSFFSEVLTHFRLAPGQLVLSGWRVLVGFVVLCHDAGVPPSTDVFLYLFSLVRVEANNCWYRFDTKDDNRVLFTGLSASDEGWKGRFFFLTSPEPWPCPVRWSKPASKYKNYGRCVSDPVVKKTVAKLMDAHLTAVDLRTYLSDTKLAATFSSNLASPPSGPSLHATSAKGMDSSVAFASPPPGPSLASPGVQGMDSSAAKVKPEPDATLSLRKRKHEEAAIVKDGICRSGQSTPHAAIGYSTSAPGLGAPPGFDPKPHHSSVPDTHDGNSADWEAARKVLEFITTPSRECAFATANPADVVASSYAAMLQASNYASFSFGYALELEKKLAARDKDNAALREQLQSAKAELTAAKRAAEAEVESVKKTSVQQFLASEEHTRRLTEHGLVEYKRGAEETKRAALRIFPRLELYL